VWFLVFSWVDSGSNDHPTVAVNSKTLPFSASGMWAKCFFESATSESRGNAILLVIAKVIAVAGRTGLAFNGLFLLHVRSLAEFVRSASFVMRVYSGGKENC